MTASKKKILDFLLDTALRGDLLRAVQKANLKTLTVLNYHRIADITSPGFDTFKPVVSASLEMFSSQMDYIADHYNVINCNVLLKWLQGEAKLPTNPALITFDDGYYDNLKYAYPVLRDRGLSAIIFLASGYMGSQTPFFWDYSAYCFYHTEKDSVQMPNGERLVWANTKQLDKIVNKWVMHLKYLQEGEKRAYLERLSVDLAVAVPDNAFNGLFLSWDQVREMNNGIIEFGAHTVTHPILSKVSLEQAASELFESKRRIESEIGSKVVAFAYPNGGTSDFSAEVVDLVKKTGYEMAFSLLPGPASYKEIKNNKFTIRRIFIGNSDTLPRFAAKLIGGERLQEALQTLLN